MGYMKRLVEDVCELYHLGLSYKEIQAMTGLSKIAVDYIIKEHYKTYYK